jgi:putative protease
MCLAYSGRCYLSRYYTGRSANLGDCAQPCRWQYRINEVNRPYQSLIIDEEEEGMYILNSRDLCLLKHLKELSQAGVKHFKIEGRAKSVYYAAVATGSYRESIDCLGEKGKGQYLNWLSGELEDKLTHRGYSTGFLFGQPEEPDQARRQAEPGWELCGQVIGARGSAGEVLVKVHNSLRTTDRIEAVLPYYQPVALKILEIKEVNGRVIQEAHGGQDKQVFIQADQKLPLFTVLRRKLIP